MGLAVGTIALQAHAHIHLQPVGQAHVIFHISRHDGHRAFAAHTVLQAAICNDKVIVMLDFVTANSLIILDCLIQTGVLCNNHRGYILKAEAYATPHFVLVKPV